MNCAGAVSVYNMKSTKKQEGYVPTAFDFFGAVWRQIACLRRGGRY